MKAEVTPRLFALSLGLSLCVFWKPLWTLAQFSLRSEQYSHIPLIPLISAVLLYQERSAMFAQPKADWIRGGVCAGVGAFLHVLSLLLGSMLSENDNVSLSVFSIVLMWLGLFLGFYGLEPFRKAAFPLLFLFLMVPIPELILSKVIQILQHASAEATAMLFSVSGIPVYREGLTFSLPGLTIEVAQECSGIRSSLALFITSLLAGHLFLRTRTRKALLWAVVLPITIFKNGLRIVTLSALAVYVNPAILDSTAHRRGGIPFFGLALLVLGAVLWFLQKTERRSWTQQRKSSTRNSGEKVPPSTQVPRPLAR